MNHRLQLFDTPESLAGSVTRFLAEGHERGDNLLVVAKPQHRDAIFSAIGSHGGFDGAAEGAQRLVALDAAEVLQDVTRNGRVDAELFESQLATLVEGLASSRKLTIYAELVELLAEEGDFDGAIRLEEMWNALASRVGFVLMCGYSSAHFAAAHSALRDICRAHSDVKATAEDTLGSWLLTTA